MFTHHHLYHYFHQFSASIHFAIIIITIINKSLSFFISFIFAVCVPICRFWRQSSSSYHHPKIIIYIFVAFQKRIVCSVEIDLFFLPFCIVFHFPCFSWHDTNMNGDVELCLCWIFWTDMNHFSIFSFSDPSEDNRYVQNSLFVENDSKIFEIWFKTVKTPIFVKVRIIQD